MGKGGLVGGVPLGGGLSREEGRRPNRERGFGRREEYKKKF